MRKYDPIKHLDGLGVRVVTGGRDMEYSGIYVHEGRAIILRPGMSDRLKRCVLTHEAVHAEHGDVPQWDEEHHRLVEIRTDIIMSHRLITHSQWREVQHMDIQAICDRLDVVPHVVEVYRRYSGLILPRHRDVLLAS